MPTNPLISVIVPIYKVEEYLRECIDSILNQTYQNLEIILVNDGSPDSCGQICEEYAKQDDRIVVIHKENGGLSDARNAGLDICKGEYISFVDSDDRIHPQFIEILYQNLVENKAEISIVSLLKFNKNSDIYICNNSKLTEFSKNQIFDNLYDNSYCPNLVVAWNKLYKKDLFDKIRYPKGRVHEDEFVIHHIYGKCSKIILSFNQLYYYRQRPKSIMSNFSEKKYLDFIDAMHDRILFSDHLKNDELKKETLNNILKYNINNFSKSNFHSRIKSYLREHFIVVIIFLYNTRHFNLKEKLFFLFKLL